MTLYFKKKEKEKNECSMGAKAKPVVADAHGDVLIAGLHPVLAV
jgi:hypothetical protein